MKALLLLLLAGPAFSQAVRINDRAATGAVQYPSSGTFSGTGYALQVPNGNVFVGGGQVYNTKSGYAEYYANGTSGGAFKCTTGTECFFDYPSGGAMVIRPNSAEKARFDSTGALVFSGISGGSSVVVDSSTYRNLGQAAAGENVYTFTGNANNSSFQFKPRRSDGNSMYGFKIDSNGNAAFNKESDSAILGTGIEISSRPLVLTGSGGGTISNGISTFTPVGVLFFASSVTTASQGASTCTVGGSVTVNFSTYTLAANALSADGDTLLIECMYQNSATAPISPANTVIVVGMGSSNTEQSATGNNTSLAFVRVRSYITRVAATTAVIHGDVWSRAINGNSTTPTATDSGGNQVAGVGFSFATTHAIRCQAQENGGGRVNFQWMKVSKQ